MMLIQTYWRILLNSYCLILSSSALKMEPGPQCQTQLTLVSNLNGSILILFKQIISDSYSHQGHESQGKNEKEFAVHAVVIDVVFG